MIAVDADTNVLLLREEIFKDESLDSYLTRLAALNKVRSLNDLPGSSKLVLEHYTAPWFEALSSLTGASPSSLVEASPLWLASKLLHPQAEMETIAVGNASHRVSHKDTLPRLARQLTRRSRLQFCPDCLREQAYHRLTWYPKMNCYCTAHRALLVTQCPGCKENVDIESLVRSRCQVCGTFLAAAPTGYLASASTVHQAQLLLNKWWHSTPLDPALSSHNLPTDNVRVLLTLTTGLANVARRSGIGLSTDHRSSWDIPDEVRHETALLQAMDHFDHVTTAVLALNDWPNGFFSFLDHVRERSGRHYPLSELRGEFPYLYSDYLERDWLFPEFHSIQSAFDDYLEVNYQYCRSVEKIRRYRDDPSFRSRFKYISMQEAARRMGVPTDEIEALIRQGALMCQFRHHHPAEIGYWLLPYPVDYLASEYIGCFGVSEAAHFFGIAEEMIEQLAELGILEHDAMPSDSRGPCLTGRSVWRFRYRFQSAQQRYDGLEMSLEEAMRYLAHRDWNGARVLKAILEGQLRCCYGGVNIGLSRVARDDVLELLKDSGRDYLGELALPITARFGVDLTRVIVWHQLGLLTEDKTPGGLKRITEEEIRRFHERYILYGEAPRVLGIQPGSFETWINKGRFKELGYSEYGVHSGVFLRAEIERFAPGRTLTRTEISRMYGINGTRLDSWVAAGELAPVTGPGVDNCAHHRFAREEVERLVNGMKALRDSSEPQ